MMKYFCFIALYCCSVCFAKEEKAKDVTGVIKAHLGLHTKTDPFRGQLSTIRDARSLNCNFPMLELCCWFNAPKPVDDIDWVLVNTTVYKPWFHTHYGGKTIKTPNPPFLVASAASQSSAERAVLVSCAIPCQRGSGQITLDHWLDEVELDICRMPVNNMVVVEPCANVKGTGTTTVMVEALPEPYYIVIIATGFGPNGLAVIDNIQYGAQIPPKCPT